MNKFLVLPGVVWSRHDGDMHHISAERLIQLYGVKLSECVIARDDGTVPGMSPEMLKSLIQLSPRRDGNYQIPTA
jgi:hypothetical protein